MSNEMTTPGEKAKPQVIIPDLKKSIDGKSPRYGLAISLFMIFALASTIAISALVIINIIDELRYDNNAGVSGSFIEQQEGNPATVDNNGVSVEPTAPLDNQTPPGDNRDPLPGNQPIPPEAVPANPPSEGGPGQPIPPQEGNLEQPAPYQEGLPEPPQGAPEAINVAPVVQPSLDGIVAPPAP